MPGGMTTYDSVDAQLFRAEQIELFQVQADSIPDYMDQLYSVSSTDIFTEKMESYPGISDFTPWNFAGTTGTEQLQNGYSITISQLGWRKQVAIDFKTQRFIQYKERISRTTNDMAFAGKNTMNDYAVGWLMNQLFGVGDKWCTEEAQYLFSASHPLKAGGTASNYSTNPLTYSNLMTGIVALMLQVDEQGRRMHQGKFNIELWAYDGDYDTVMGVLNQGIAYAPGSANLNVNLMGRNQEFSITPKFCEHITDNAWMLKLGDKGKTGLKAFKSVPLAPRMYKRDDDEATIYEAKFGFNVGARDWRGVYGSRGTG